MNDRDLKRQIVELSNVALVRMLTLDSARTSVEERSLAQAEAERRGLPIDEAFIPAEDADREAVDVDGEFDAGGKALACPQCGNHTFAARDILLNTRALTFFKLDWLNQSATALTCANWVNAVLRDGAFAPAQALALDR